MYNYNQKADFNKERVHAYQRYFGQTGLSVVPQKIGFKPNVQVIKKSNFTSVLTEIELADYVALDTETTSLKFGEAEVISINVGLSGNSNYVGFYYKGFFDEDKRPNLVSEDELDEIIRLILSKPIVFMHNRYYDQQVLMHARGFKEEQFWTCHCTLQLLWALDSNQKSGLNLKQAGQDFLGIPRYGLDEDVWDDITKADPKVLIMYGALDAYCTLELGILLYKIYKKHYPFMLQLHLEFKNALFPFGEQHQVLDVPYLEEAAKELDGLIEEVKARFFESYGVINMASPRQKSDLLLKLGYSTGVWNKPSKDGNKIMSTSADLLQTLADKGCEPAQLMIRHSKLMKLQSSYVTPMLEAGKSGKPVRFYFRDHDTATLRLSAGAYNINRKKYDYYLGISTQTMPKPHKINRELNYDPRTFSIGWPEGRGQYYVETGAPELNMRKAFCAKSGGLIIKADFSQQELVIPANFANETTWLNALKEGKDLHKATGQMVYGREVKSDERQLMKACFSDDSWFSTSNGWVRGYDLPKSILSLDGMDQNWVGLSESRKGYKVFLSNGQILTVTEDHLFYNFYHLIPKYEKITDLDLSSALLGVKKDVVYSNSYVWVKAYQNRSRFGSIASCDVKIDEAFAYLLGLYLGDGCLPNGKMGKFTLNQVVDKSNFDYVFNEWSRLVFITKSCQYKTTAVRFAHFDNYSQVFVGSRALGGLINSLCGFAEFKHVPDEIFRSPRSVIVSFIAGLIDSDGSVSSSLEFCNSNRTIISGVADLFAYLGLEVSVHSAIARLYGVPKKEAFCLRVLDPIPDLLLRHSSKASAYELVLKKRNTRGWLVSKNDIFTWCTSGNKSLWSACNGKAPFYFNATGCYGKSYLHRQWFEDNGFEHKDYVPVKILKIAPCELSALVLETESHEFICMGQRSHNCNFGIMYETENPEYVIANQTGWSIEKAREFFVKYKAALPRLYAWKEKVMLEGRTTGSIKNLYGFERRVYSYYHTADRRMHRFGDRTCINQAVQGTAAIMMRILMVKFWKLLYLPQGKYFNKGISFLNSAHDEMVFRVDDVSILPAFLPDFVETMASVTPSDWPVRLGVEVEIGQNYGEMFVVKQDYVSGLWLPKEEEREVKQTITSNVSEVVMDDWEEKEFAEELVGFHF